MNAATRIPTAARPRPFGALLALGVAIALAPPAVPAQQPPSNDRHGDPLPPGALARLGTTRLRSTASALAVSADGKTVLTAAGGRTVGRWDPETGRLRDEIHLAGAVSDRTRFSADGRALAVLEYRAVEVWDLARRACRRLAAEALRVAFAPDRRTLATAEYKDKKYLIQLWDLDTGDPRHLADLPSYANDLVFSPDGKRLFAAVDNRSLRCWDVVSGKELWRNDHGASRVAVAPDGRILCTDSYQRGTLRLWDGATGKELGAFESERRWTGSVAFSPDGAAVAVGAGSEVTLWDVAARKVRHRSSPAGPAVAFAPDGKSLFTLGATLGRWDVGTGKPLYPDTRGHGHVGAVTGAAFAPGGRALATCGADATLRVWDLGGGGHRVLRSDAHPAGYRMIATGHGSYVSAGPLTVVLAFTPDGRNLLAEAEGGAALTDVATGKVLRQFVLPRPKDRGMMLAAARLTADGRTLLALGEPMFDGTGSTIEFDGHESPARGWDVATGRETFARSLRAHSLREAEFSPDGRLLVLPHTTKMLDPRGKGERPLVDAPRWLVRPNDFTADSRLFASVESDDLHGAGRGVRVYETLTGRQVTRIEGALGNCQAAGFSPDGRLLAVAGGDALHVWEVTTGKRLLHLAAKGRLTHWTPAGFAECLAFSPDGKALATGHADGTALLWDMTDARKGLTVPAGAVDAEACWRDLMAEDPRIAYVAIDRLASAPARALPLLRERVRPVKVERQWLTDRIADLDSRTFATRDAAERELLRVAEAVEAELLGALAKASSLETQRRLGRVLESIRPLAQPPPETVRRLRAVVILERVGSDEAREVLRELAAGAAGDPLTREAAAALERLRRQGSLP